MFRKLENLFSQYALILCSGLAFLTIHPLSAQEQAIVKEASKDTVLNDYIIDYKKRFNVKLEVSNDVTT